MSSGVRGSLCAVRVLAFMLFFLKFWRVVTVAVDGSGSGVVYFRLATHCPLALSFDACVQKIATTIRARLPLECCWIQIQRGVAPGWAGPHRRGQFMVTCSCC